MDDSGYECTYGEWHTGIDPCPSQGRTEREVQQDESQRRCPRHGTWHHVEGDCMECEGE